MKSLVVTVAMVILVFGVGHSSAESWPSDSIFQIQSTWRDQNNTEVQLKKFTGQPIIIGMVYTKCPHACPMTISKIKDIERAMAGSKIQYKVVLASFDPKSDTPTHLKQYMQRHKLDEKKWVFLSAPNDSTSRELAVALGINYKPIEGGDFSHSNILTVLNAKGSPTGNIQNLSADVAPLVDALKQ